MKTSTPIYRSSTITFADLVNQHLSFSSKNPIEALLLDLIDTPWVQRLRAVTQTANTKFVYMFSEHSRFGHSIGVAYLARKVVTHLKNNHPEIANYEAAVSVAALLHDVGHLAPGSHAAFKTWFPECKDIHEEITAKIVSEDPTIYALLSAFDVNLPHQVVAILREDASVPPWTWQIISGGGWNVDRGNWCYVDSVLAGVDYGKYNIPAIVESLTITAGGNLSFFENRLDAMMHFAVSRHALYRQVYHHRVLLAADVLSQSIVKRARAMLEHGLSLPFADDVMKEVLGCHNPLSLRLTTIFKMRESWWNYHLMHWSESSDTTLSDLSLRLLHRRLFKTVRLNNDDIASELKVLSTSLLRTANLDPAYYLHEISSVDMQGKDNAQAPLVLREDGSVILLTEADPLFKSLAQSERKAWLVMPAEIKRELGRDR
jgi:uncharacterized protein